VATGGGPMSSRAQAQTSAYLPGLVWTLIRTDFKTRYHGTVGGYLWALAKPLTMFAVLLGVFSFIFSDKDYPLYLVIGLFLWDFFNEATKTGLGCLHAKGFLLTKAKFPTWILSLTSVSNALITMAFFVVVVCGYICIFRRPLSVVDILLFLVYLAAYVAIVVGFSLAASVLFLRYRDLNQVWELVLQAGFFVAPVIYPLDIIPERFHFYLYLWPPTPVIQFTRSVLVEGEIPTARAHTLLACVVIVILTVGIAVYRRWAPRAIEEL
jgi:lipopolysaccharide transport system permease protein